MKIEIDKNLFQYSFGIILKIKQNIEDIKSFQLFEINI
jgi:hypothetical protein